ncbi:MAG: T9SS type A sorting domain-containing protein [Flavobacteriales bacterium]
MRVLAVISVLFCLTAAAQFDPAAGQTGSLAVHKDSAAIHAWATGCAVVRGYQDISNKSLGYATVGDSSMATGSSDAGVVSLGDGGSAILTFKHPIRNGAGPDFAVFENSFSDTYLELAFVEVSSDGINYFRFPATSNTDTSTAVGSFGALDASKLNNLAGKYRAQYGTPFDLEELKNEAGLNVEGITHVKIIDVVGSVDNAYATRDKNNHKINDPWPTAFASSGFDLEAVGVIYEYQWGIEENYFSFSAYPNPAGNELFLRFEGNASFQVLDMKGQLQMEQYGTNALQMDVSQLPSGIYLLKVTAFNKCYVGKFSKM